MDTRHNPWLDVMLSGQKVDLASQLATFGSHGLVLKVSEEPEWARQQLGSSAKLKSLKIYEIQETADL